MSVTTLRTESSGCFTLKAHLRSQQAKDRRGNAGNVHLLHLLGIRKMRWHWRPTDLRYSSRNAVIGSTLAARRAGIQQASKPTHVVRSPAAT